jgi:hypothetical protein
MIASSATVERGSKMITQQIEVCRSRVLAEPGDRRDRHAGTLNLALPLSLSFSLSLILSLAFTLTRAPPESDARAPRAYRTSATSMACTSLIFPVSAGSTLSTYPSASATSRHASVSRADPSAVRYRASRVPPCDPLPSAMLSATLLAALRS